MQAASPAQLPTPDAASADHSRRCAAFIRDEIAEAGGSISFAEFMHHALYAPGLGYYTAGSRKFGEAGDFVTAPEVSPLFGRVVARQCADALRRIPEASVLELGAGSGRLAADVLAKLGALDALPESYLILEPSPDLQERQSALLHDAAPEHVGRVQWLEHVPRSHRGVVLANEVLDALPVERFVRRDGVMQQRVVVDGDGFAYVETAAPKILDDAVAAIEDELGSKFSDGYVSEVSLALPGWVRDIVDELEEGVALLFDYGVSRREYYGAERSGGWLRCHFRHHAHNDALILPGIQDITAWVDFTAVASAASEAGAGIAGYVTQASFLLAGGLDAELDDIDSLATVARSELSSQAKMLTLPGAMGEHFKCMALVKGDAVPPAAVTGNDRTHTL